MVLYREFDPGEALPQAAATAEGPPQQRREPYLVGHEREQNGAAGAETARLPGLQRLRRDDLGHSLGFDPGRGRIERGRVGRAAQHRHEMVGRDERVGERYVEALSAHR